MKVLGGLSLLFVNGTIARLLPPEEMGQYLLLYSLATMASLVCVLGLNEFSVRTIAAHYGSSQTSNKIPDDVRRVLSTLAWSIMVCVAVGAIVAFVVAKVYPTQKVTPPIFLLLVALTGSFALRMVLTGIFRGLERMLLAGLFAGTAANVLFGLALVPISGLSLRVNLLQVVALTAAAGVASAALAMACLARIVGERLVSLRPERPAEILRQSLPMMGVTFLPQSAQQLTFWIVALVGTTAEVAEYGLAVRLFQSLSMLLMISNLLGAPFVAELHAASDLNRLRAVARTLATVAAVPIVILLLGILVFGEHAMALAFGEYYRSAASVALLLGVGRAVQALLGLSPMLLMMTGHERVVLLVRAVGAAAQVGAATIGYRLAGVDGVAAAVSSVAVLEAIALAVLVRHLLGFWATAAVNPTVVLSSARGRFT